MSRAIRNCCRLACLALVLLVLVGCDAGTSVRGIVSETNGRPVAGASVRLLAVKNGKMAEMNSEADGSFHVTMLHGPFPGEFQLLVSKPGYLTFKRDIQAKTRQQLDVVLTPQQGTLDSPR